MCDIAYALLVEQVEGDQRAMYAAAGAASEDGMEEREPEQARVRLETWLMSTAADRPAGISDDEWELRVALGVTGGRG